VLRRDERLRRDSIASARRRMAAAASGTAMAATTHRKTVFRTMIA
jgi:hypothetical protein